VLLVGVLCGIQCVYVNTMREIKRVLETIMAGDDETEVTEGTSPAAVAVPVVLVVIIVIIVVSIFIVRRRRRNHRKANGYSTPVHDTDTLHVSYSCYYCPQTDLHMHRTLHIPLLPGLKLSNSPDMCTCTTL